MTDQICRMCSRPLGQHSMDTADTCNMFIAGDPHDVVGHKTFGTGERDENGLPVFRHEPLTRAESEALWQSAKEAERLRAERIPDEQAAIRALWDAHQRLKELGWKEPQYCPKDGTRFRVIELGSTGVFDCYYQGEWPNGFYMVMDEHDCYPTSSGVAMYRLYPDDEAKEKQRWKEAGERYWASIAEEREPRTAAGSLD